jgi:hypothetical protein
LFILSQQVCDDFYDEWWDKKQQELRLRGSNSDYANSTLLGGPLQAVCLAHGVRPQVLGYAPSAASNTGFERSLGACLPKGAAAANLWCCDPLEAEAAHLAAAHLAAAAAAQPSAPHDQADDHGQRHVLSAGSAVHAESDATSAQLAAADGALPSAPSTTDTQQPSLQAAVLAPHSTVGAGVAPAAALEVPAAEGLQGAPAEAPNSSALAVSAAAQASEADTGPQHAPEGPDTGLSTEGLQDSQHATAHSTEGLQDSQHATAPSTDGLQDSQHATAPSIEGLQDSQHATAPRTEGLQDSQHATAPSTAQDTLHASTHLTELDTAGSTRLAADVLQYSAVQSLANITSKLGAYSVQLWGKVTGREPATAGEHATVCDQHQGLREAYQPAAAGEECSALQGDAAAGAQELLQESEQQQEEEEGMAHPTDARDASLHLDVPMGAFLTPDMVMHAYKRMGE